MRPASDCPTPQAWLDYAAGRLDAEARDRLAAHLDVCLDCLALAGEALAEHREAPTRDGAPAAHPPPRALAAPLERVGRYLVLEPLGKGGMGEVLLAYDPSLDRRVALKLAQRRPGDGTHDLEARLEREAQLLARATDRHVVAVYDSGEHEGRPWVAMEYVPGATLKTWLGSTRSRAEVLRVFTDAARGLAAAHRVGVVHRDFKPDNVLLDAQGCARVTDFGLAALREAPATPDAADAGDSALADDETQPLHGTRPGSVMGTPGYMSPEQWDARPVDARSDQFSFCVALHEALLGERPFMKPSVRGTRPTFERTPASLQRLKEQPAPLRALLTRGLSLDPAARFESMEAVIAGLERAQRAPRWPWVVLATTACAALAVGAALWATRSPCHGALERVRAPRLALGALPLRVSALGEALETRWAHAWDTACAETHERHEQPAEVLALRNDCLGRQARRYQLVLAQAASPEPTAGASALEALELSPRPEDCLAVESLLAVEPPPPDAHARAWALREQVWGARVNVELGQYLAARTQLEALEAPVAALGYRRVRAEYEYAWGLLALRELDYRVARSRYHLALGAALASRDFELAALVGAELLFVGAQLGLVEEAQLTDELTSALVDKLGSATLEGKLENVRGTVASVRGRFDDARVHLLKARALREAVFGRRHLETANVIANLGGLANRSGRPAEAEALLREELSIREELLGPRHPQLARTLVALASSLLEQGKMEPAVELATRAYQLRRDVLGPAHRLTHDSRLMLAEYLVAAERYDEARALQLETLAASEAGSLDAAKVASALSNLEHRAGRLDEALRWCRTARATFDALAPRDEETLWEREHEAELLVDLGDGRGADRLLAPLEREWRSREDAATRLADVLLLRARASLLLGRREAALAQATEGRDIYLPLDFWPGRRAEVDLVMGQALFAAGHHTQALTLVTAARATLSGPATRHEAAKLDRWLSTVKTK